MKEILEQTLALLRGRIEFLKNEGIDEDVFVWGSELDECHIRIDVISGLLLLQEKL